MNKEGSLKFRAVRDAAIENMREVLEEIKHEGPGEVISKDPRWLAAWETIRELELLQCTQCHGGILPERQNLIYPDWCPSCGGSGWKEG